MDMGVENRNLYTADVTRVLPVDGRFTPLQRQVYDAVHAAQQAGIEMCRPGVQFRDVHLASMRVLTEALDGLGLLPVSVDEAMDPESTIYRRWTLHGTSHMLGIDVHDCANARKEMYREGPLGEGYVLTVEPGLYFQPEDELVPEELRGIGVRIEDDILVTVDGPVNSRRGCRAARPRWRPGWPSSGRRVPACRADRRTAIAAGSAAGVPTTLVVAAPVAGPAAFRAGQDLPDRLSPARWVPST